MLKVTDLSVRYGPYTIVDKVSFSVEENQWMMVVGPNGAGKSTLIGAISQGVEYTGSVQFGEEDLSRCKPGLLARRIGVLQQSHTVGYSFTVEEVVRLGRYAYSKGILSSPSEEDEEMVQRALEMTGLLPLSRQSVLTLSGGELQRTFLAQVLAQDPALLLLDEPSNHLDIKYQQQVYELVEEWRRGKGRAVLSVVHDISLAKVYGTHAMLMRGGRVLDQGQNGVVFSPENLEKAYGIDVYAWMQTLLGQWVK